MRAVRRVGESIGELDEREKTRGRSRLEKWESCSRVTRYDYQSTSSASITRCGLSAPSTE